MPVWKDEYSYKDRSVLRFDVGGWLSHASDTGARQEGQALNVVGEVSQYTLLSPQRDRRVIELRSLVCLFRCPY